MKRLLSKLLLFLSPLAALALVDAALLAPDTFTFRCWEALEVRANALFPGPFYPERRLERSEVGDLGRHTRYAVPRDVVWETDRYGFRHSGPSDGRLVVVLGDSFTASSGVTQAEAFAPQLQAACGRRVYPYAPALLGRLLEDERFVDRLDLVVVQVVERSLFSHRAPRLEPEWPNPGRRLPRAALRALEVPDRLVTRAMLQWTRAELRRAARHLVSDSPSPSCVIGADDRTLFLSGARALRRGTPGRIARAVDWFEDCRARLAARGIPIVALPVPNKETVLVHLLPGAPPPADALEQVVAGVRARGIPCVDLVTPLRAADRSGVEVYQPDDTHWGPAGIRIAAKHTAAAIGTVLGEPR